MLYLGILGCCLWGRSRSCWCLRYCQGSPMAFRSVSVRLGGWLRSFSSVRNPDRHSSFVCLSRLPTLIVKGVHDEYARRGRAEVSYIVYRASKNAAQLVIKVTSQSFNRIKAVQLSTITLKLHPVPKASLRVILGDTPCT